MSLRSLLILATYSAAAGFHATAPLLQPRAAPVALRRPALQLSATAAAAAATATPDDETRPQPALMPKLRRTAALVAGSVLLTPALALASSAAGEHLHLGQKLALFFRGTGLPDWAILVLVSMLPAVELRGGVPVGAWMGLTPLTTFVICVIGNMIPIAPTLLALRSDAVKKARAAPTPAHAASHPPTATAAIITPPSVRAGRQAAARSRQQEAGQPAVGPVAHARPRALRRHPGARHRRVDRRHHRLPARHAVWRGDGCARARSLLGPCMAPLQRTQPTLTRPRPQPPSLRASRSPASS